MLYIVVVAGQQMLHQVLYTRILSNPQIILQHSNLLLKWQPHNLEHMLDKKLHLLDPLQHKVHPPQELSTRDQVLNAGVVYIFANELL